MKNREWIIAVDIDGVLCDHDSGIPFPRVKEFIAKLKQYGTVIIHSSRNIDRIRNFVKKMQLDCNIWNYRGKPHAEVYIDDKAVRCFGDKEWDDVLREVEFRKNYRQYKPMIEELKESGLLSRKLEEVRDEQVSGEAKRIK